MSSWGDARTAPAETGTPARTGPGETRAPEAEQLSLRKLMAEHRAVSLGALAVLLALAVTITLGALEAGNLRVTDSTSCSAWATANQSTQAAYARLYVREHGPVSGGARDVSSVEDAVNAGCTQAFSFDEADTVTVLQAARRQY